MAILVRGLSLVLFSSLAIAQTTISGTNTAAATTTNLGDSLPTGSEVSYISYGSTSTAATGSMEFSSMSVASNTSSGTATSTSSVTLLVGGNHTTTFIGNSTASRTSAAVPTNTQPCNGYAEFCTRSYSNITYVAAHNSPFTNKNNIAANQNQDVTTQLNDGIRMLQFQTHLVNGTMRLCHTSCDLLDAGTLEAYLVQVRAWLLKNPYEVITILMGNDDLVNPNNYTAPFTNAGLLNYLFTPPKVPMAVGDWPTLSEMILRHERVVVMLDYDANQTAIPWLMDEFGQMWESPFSPTDRDFPCTAQRPPSTNAGALPRTNRMYLANHNLNVDVTLLGASVLIPGITELNVTNGVQGYSSLGLMADNCTAMWGRPPNFLLVDYYNIGGTTNGSYDGQTFTNGSTLAVAAKMNNVTYDPQSCCGTASIRGDASDLVSRRSGVFVFAMSVFLGVMFLV